MLSIHPGCESNNTSLEYFKVPPTSVELIRTKLVMTIFDDYTNILKGMYNRRTGRMTLCIVRLTLSLQKKVSGTVKVFSNVIHDFKKL